MTITTNRMIQLAITSDPTTGLAGATWSFGSGDLVDVVDASLNAEVVSTPGVMQPGDTADLDGNGSFESVYQGRFNFSGSTWTLGDGSTVSAVVPIVEFTTGGVSSYYVVVNDSIAADLDGKNLASLTLGPSMSTSPNTAGLNFDDASSYQLVCFVAGTRIATTQGERPVERLSVGDQVITRDNGPQTIRWIGSRTVPGRDRFAPVEFAPGAIGNSDALRLSRQHRVCVASALSELYFGSHEVLVPACALIGGAGVEVRAAARVTYFHLLFDRHELVRSNGVWTESFFPGPGILSAQGRLIRDEILQIFPQLAISANAYGAAVRPCLTAREGSLLRTGLVRPPDICGS